ncbi:MAG: ABC transporter ATP-binding protein, partial [Actinomycetota bacterium]
MSIETDPAQADPAQAEPGGQGAAEPAPFALQVRGLWKSYGAKVAVADLNLDIPRASFFGLVGPNGAGKT